MWKVSLVNNTVVSPKETLSKLKKRPIFSILSGSASVTFKPSISTRHLRFIIAGGLFISVMLILAAFFVIRIKKRDASVFPFWLHGEEETMTQTTS